MAHIEFGWETATGSPVYAQGWEPETPPKAVVCLVHGLGEHSGRYGHVADYLNAAGYAVLSFDLRGHGKTIGPRGVVKSFEDFLVDIDRLLVEAEKRYPEKPRFLYGHSLGGLLVLNYVLKRQPNVTGVVVTSPGLRSSVQTQKAKMLVANVMGSLLPNMDIANGLELQALSRDPEVIRRYQADPLVHDRASLAMAKNSIGEIPWTFAHASEFTSPLLLMHGTADRITFCSGSQDFAAQAKDCTLKLWEGMYHELHNEPEKEQVLAYLLGWLDSHL
jgi:alpha-beta hydrolase superfamily lysophospholipase